MIRPLAPFRMRPLKSVVAPKPSSHATLRRIAEDATGADPSPALRRSLALRKPLRARSPLKGADSAA